MSGRIIGDMLKSLLEMVSDTPETSSMVLEPKDALTQVDRQIKILSTRLQGMVSMREKLADEMVNQQLKTNIRHIDHGTWDCQDSPTGRCAYNGEEDPVNDECLFCGDPDERK